MDYIAASFVRTAEGVREIREYAAEVVREKFGPEHPIPLIVSKIESQEALDNWDEILDESDAIMVARGDLGVEVTLQTCRPPPCRPMQTRPMRPLLSPLYAPLSMRDAPLSITPGAAADRRDLAEEDRRGLQRGGQARDRRDPDAREHAEEPARHARRGRPPSPTSSPSRSKPFVPPSLLLSSFTGVFIATSVPATSKVRVCSDTLLSAPSSSS